MFVAESVRLCSSGGSGHQAACRCGLGASPRVPCFCHTSQALAALGADYVLPDDVKAIIVRTGPSADRQADQLRGRTGQGIVNDILESVPIVLEEAQVLEAIGELISVKRESVTMCHGTRSIGLPVRLYWPSPSVQGPVLLPELLGDWPAVSVLTQALIMLLLPPITGFLTYLHAASASMVAFWRSLQLVLAAGVFSSAGGTPWGLVTGIIAAATSWVVAVNLGSSSFLSPRPSARESTRKNLLT